MAKKKNLMPNLYPHDQKAFHMLSTCGKCELRDLRNVAGITKTRANTYIKMGYVKREKDPTTGKSIYQLTSKKDMKNPKDVDGRTWVKQTYGYTPYSAKSWRHDSGLRDAYKKIPEECRASIKTEDQFKEDLKTWIKEEKASGDADRWNRANDIESRWNAGKLSCPDFSYVNSENQTVYIESITDYPKNVIEAKIEMAREFNAVFQGIQK